MITLALQIMPCRLFFAALLNHISRARRGLYYIIVLLFADIKKLGTKDWKREMNRTNLVWLRLTQINCNNI